MYSLTPAARLCEEQRRRAPLDGMVAQATAAASVEAAAGASDGCRGLSWTVGQELAAALITERCRWGCLGWPRYRGKPSAV